MMVLSAGASIVDITPDAGLAMGGYGARTSPATGCHDQLTARALVLSDGRSEAAIVICDLLGTPATLVEQVRQAAGRLGFDPDAVLVSATHTHAGPGIIYSRRLTDYVEQTAVRIAGCIERARAAMRPAELRVSRTRLETISQNRRDPEGPIEPEALILSFAGIDDGSAIATVVNYACHATVLESDNLQWSADFPGAACRFIEVALGGVALYMQGCCGDINPLWVRHDFREVQRLGEIVGAAAVRAVHEALPVGGSGQFGINLSWSEEILQEPPSGALIGQTQVAARRVQVELQRRTLGPLDEIEAQISALESELHGLNDGDSRRHELMPRLNRLNIERTVQSFPQLQPPDCQSVEVQAICLGSDCAIVSLPGEFFVQTGASLREEAGIEHLAIAGYANDYIGYVPPANEFPKGGYEVGFARFSIESEEAIRSAAVDALRAVMQEPRQ